MKMTVEQALQLVAERTMANASPPRPCTTIWLRAMYRRRQRQRARFRLLRALVPAVVAAIWFVGLQAWNGDWLRTDGLRQLDAMAASASNAFGAGLPLAALVGLGLAACLVMLDPLRRGR